MNFHILFRICWYTTGIVCSQPVAIIAKQRNHMAMPGWKICETHESGRSVGKLRDLLDGYQCFQSANIMNSKGNFWILRVGSCVILWHIYGIPKSKKALQTPISLYMNVMYIQIQHTCRTSLLAESQSNMTLMAGRVRKSRALLSSLGVCCSMVSRSLAGRACERMTCREKRDRG